jgi:hypothetical protein
MLQLVVIRGKTAGRFGENGQGAIERNPHLVVMVGFHGSQFRDGRRSNYGSRTGA